MYDSPPVGFPFRRTGEAALERNSATPLPRLFYRRAQSDEVQQRHRRLQTCGGTLLLKALLLNLQPVKHRTVSRLGPKRDPFRAVPRVPPGAETPCATRLDWRPRDRHGLAAAVATDRGLLFRTPTVPRIRLTQPTATTWQRHPRTDIQTDPSSRGPPASQPAFGRAQGFCLSAVVELFSECGLLVTSQLPTCPDPYHQLASSMFMRPWASWQLLSLSTLNPELPPSVLSVDRPRTLDQICPQSIVSTICSGQHLIMLAIWFDPAPSAQLRGP